MRRWIAIVVGAIVAVAIIAVAVQQWRVQRRLGDRLANLADRLQAPVGSQSQPIPPGRRPEACVTADRLADAVTRGGRLSTADREALEAFVAGPTAEDARAIAPLLTAWGPALTAWWDAPSCATPGVLEAPLDVADLRLVLAARLAEDDRTDTPSALDEALDAWITARALMRVGGVAEYVAAADLVTDAAAIVEARLLDAEPIPRTEAVGVVAFLADNAAPLPEAVQHDLWRIPRARPADLSDAAWMAQLEPETGVLDAWMRAAEEPDPARAAALRVLDPPEGSALPTGSQVAAAWASIAGTERIANALVVAAALTTFVEAEHTCPRDVEAARPYVPKDAWRDGRVGHVTWDESACALTVRGVDGGPLRVWTIS